jgi:aspartate/methionine/tyrosine aminotransferase
MRLEPLPESELRALVASLESEYEAHSSAGLALDLTRGKPSIAQLELSASLDGILEGDYVASDGTDARGYGGIDGLPEAKQLGAELMGIGPESVVVGGNSSLTLMYLYLMHAVHHGPGAGGGPWREVEGGVRFLCPVPGYDRHFSACEDFGIEMVPVPMTGKGPDMDAVEARVAEDPGVRGMWCVPKYSNPTGESYSDETVLRLAALGQTAPAGFQLMWDNAYAVHDLGAPEALADILPLARELGTVDSVVMFGSTSKITFAGAGLAFIGGSAATLDAFKQRLALLTIGPDKVNQLRHVRLLRDLDGIRAHMAKHRELLQERFACVQRNLSARLGELEDTRWTEPCGGYFVSFDTQPGLAREVVRLAGEAGVKLTPAGSAFPYGEDPEDRNIRLAPSYPSLDDLDRAMQVFVTCVLLASARRKLEGP